MKIEFENAVDEVKVTIYDYIGDDGVSAKDIDEKLKEVAPKPLAIHINSHGGEVFEGFAIYNLFKQYQGKKTVYIDGIAASIASVIAMSGDRIVMSNASMMMIHNASCFGYGTSDEMKHLADALEQVTETIKGVYLQKVNISKDKLSELMDQEKYLTPRECLDYGFCDEIIDETEEVDKTTPLNELLETIEQRTKTLNSLKNFQFKEQPQEPKQNKTKNFLKNYLGKEVL